MAGRESAVGAEPRQPLRFAELGMPRQDVRLNPLYGRFVNFAKVLLPTLAVALVVLVAAWPQIQEQEGRFVLGPATVEETEAENVRMVNARYIGLDQRRRPFTVTADTAEQLGGSESKVALDAPKADILLDSDTWVALTATSGTYDKDRQILELGGTVNLFHDTGYSFQTTSAVLDLGAGDAVGTEPVAGHGPFGAITSDGFRILERGARVVFTGKAHLTIKSRRDDGS